MGCLLSSGAPFTAIPPLRICPSSLGQTVPGSGPDLGVRGMFVSKMMKPDGSTYGFTGRWPCWHPGAFCLTVCPWLFFLQYIFNLLPVLAQTPSQHTLYSLPSPTRLG